MDPGLLDVRLNWKPNAGAVLWFNSASCVVCGIEQPCLVVPCETLSIEEQCTAIRHSAYSTVQHNTEHLSELLVQLHQLSKAKLVLTQPLFK